MGGENRLRPAVPLPKCLSHWFQLRRSWAAAVAGPEALFRCLINPPPKLHLSLVGPQWRLSLMIMTSLTIRLTMSSSSGLASATVMGYFLRLLQLLSTCLAFSLVATTGTWRETIGNWSMFIWCFCFVVTLLTFIVELCGLQFLWPFPWDDFLINYASYSTLLCLSASIIYPTTYLQIVPRGSSWNHAIAATAFSCLASVTYATEVAWIYAWPSHITCYVLPMPGLLKGLENFVACVIFGFISNTSLYLHQPALVWCVAAYSICLFLGAVALLLYLRGYSNKLPVCFPIFLLGLALFSIFLYASALILWLLYQFDKNFGGQPQRSSDVSCRHHHLVCIWDQRLVVAILTAINLLIYMADLVYWARWVFVRDWGPAQGLLIPSAHRRYFHRALVSSNVFFLALSLPPHILPHSSLSPFCFLPSFCSVLFPSCFVWLPTPSFTVFSCCFHLFYIFCFLPLFWSSLVFLSPVSWPPLPIFLLLIHQDLRPLPSLPTTCSHLLHITQPSVHLFTPWASGGPHCQDVSVPLAVP